MTIRRERIQVEQLTHVMGFSDVSRVSPIHDETDVDPIIVALDRSGVVSEIIDGFHRANGYHAGGLETVEAIIVSNDDDAPYARLVAAAAVPEGFGGLTQDEAIEQIMQMAG